MGLGHELVSLLHSANQLTTDHRPIRLTLFHHDSHSSNLLLPQYVEGRETVCGGFRYHVDCITTSCKLPLKDLIGLPATLEFVTDRGHMRQVCGIVSQASSGESDGAIASYRITICDAMAIMEQRVNTRVFRRMSWPSVVLVLLDEWVRLHGALAGAFDYEFANGFRLENYAEREQTVQFNESDAGFVRRLFGRSGIGWFFRPGCSRAMQAHRQAGVPTAVHTLVMFDAYGRLAQNSAGVVRYHRDDATEQRDSVTRWGAVRTLQAGGASLFSWDYKNPRATPGMATEIPGKIDQGKSGNQLAAGVQEYIVESPHVAVGGDGLYRLGLLRMQRKELDAKCFVGEGTVRDFRVGEYFTIERHPEIDAHPVAERDFVITLLEVQARNNLPALLEAGVRRLFARNGWGHSQDGRVGIANNGDAVPFQMRFEAVRRAIPIVPPFDPRTDLRDPGIQVALVVGPRDEVVHCDELGRVKIRFPATRSGDHEHAGGAGASDTDADSAWVRVASNWAGGSDALCGSLTLPRIGTEVLVAFVGGDPDKPIIISQLYNGRALPPPLSRQANLPTTRFLSGIRSQEIQGYRANQLRFDDTPGQISTQLASDDGASQLNLGWLTQPRGERSSPRGEGAELRSDNAVAIRGGKGVLITAKGSTKAEGKQLDRDELNGLADGLRDIADQLAKLAETHAKDPANGPSLAQLVDRLRRLDQGSNAVEGGSGGGEPIVAISGPAGIVMASTESMALGAEKDADLITAGDTRLAAGGRTSVRAAQGVSVFANDGGIKQIAARGDVVAEAQDGVINLIAKKVMELISTTDWIHIKARKGVRLYGGGSELTISAEGIVGITTGNNHMHAADHQTFAKKASEAQFPDELPHHDICVPCMLAAARAHSPLVEAE